MEGSGRKLTEVVVITMQVGTVPVPVIDPVACAVLLMAGDGVFVKVAVGPITGTESQAGLSVT